MKKKRKKLSGKTAEVKHNVGAFPGELYYSGDVSGHDVKMTLIQFNESEYSEEVYYDVKEMYRAIKPDFIKWVNVDGIHRIDMIEEIGKLYGIHPLTQEDILHVDSRPKFEEYSRYVVAILQMLYFENSVQSEHLGIVLFTDTVISFQEPRGGDAFDIVRNRLRECKGRVRKMGPDYLAYVLIDAVVDHYFFVIEKIGEKIEHLDDEILTNPGRNVMGEIHELKREVLLARKLIWPAREMILNMMRSETDLISETHTIYLRDVHDHINRVTDTIEQYRETLNSIMEVHLSNNANKMNEVMKALTVISAIFIPVTFIAGVYGMNFKYMPELESPYGYWITIGVMLVVMVGMGWYFKRKSWW
jgi:magnesium transporter